MSVPSRARKDNPPSSHIASCRDLIRFMERHIHFGELLRTVDDGRDGARVQIPLNAILLSFLSGLWMGIDSIRGIEDRLRHSAGFRCIAHRMGWYGTISDDTMREALSRADLSTVRAIIHRHGKRELLRWGAGRYLKCELGQRLHALGCGHLAARAVVAIDGHELFCSEKTQCKDCHVRYKKVKQKDGTVVKVRERYHKLVVAQWVGVHPAIVLDFEPILPGEGELTAAYRLVSRLDEIYGKAIGTLVADALYDCEPVRRTARNADYHTVIRHKNPKRQPGGVCKKALNRRDPTRGHPDGHFKERGGRSYQWWVEEEIERRYVEVRREDASGTVQQGACVTELPADSASAMAVAMIMESRWWVENTGFHELAGQLAFDRAFIHAGRERAVWVIAALVLVAYNGWQSYLYRHLGLDPTKPRRTWGDFRRDLWESLGEMLPARKELACIRGP